MNLSNRPCFLLDVNLLLALPDKNHIHHILVRSWFYANPDLRWAICAFTEAGFLRNATAPRAGQISMTEAIQVLDSFRQHPGYSYLPITSEWHILCKPFSARLQGTKQVTDAYLLGLAVQHSCVLVTMDRAILHLAGEEHSGHVLCLQARDQTR